MNPADEMLEPFDCPRCGQGVTERFWGPCASCRRTLVNAYAAEADPAARPDPSGPARFEPAMHVVPNHVATKD